MVSWFGFGNVSNIEQAEDIYHRSISNTADVDDADGNL